jgi:probable rRNA maturation factor
MTGVEVTVDREDVPTLELPDDEIQSLLQHALDQLGDRTDDGWEVSILLTTDDRIQQMHAEFMGIDTPTDIMTFPYELNPFVPPELQARGGDLVISVETAATNAIEATWSTDDEVRYLILHGLLHLLGWNDTTPEDRAAMLLRQDELLGSWQPAN